MARSDDFTESIGRYLRKSETALTACRATRRGGVVWTALLAGVGAAAGIAAASVVSYWRLRGAYGIRASMVTLVLTSKRVLMFRQSWLTNRAADLVKDLPLASITSIVVGDARWVSPHPVTIALNDGVAIELESAKIERPGAFAEAFRRETGS